VVGKFLVLSISGRLLRDFRRLGGGEGISGDFGGILGDSTGCPTIDSRNPKQVTASNTCIYLMIVIRFVTKHAKREWERIEFLLCF
jgi:hypothetical protein